MKHETIVLIPNYNGRQHLDECLSSLHEQTYRDFKIVFIDDFSKDNSILFVRTNFPDVDVLALPENMNFARGVNIGMKYAIDKYSPKYIAVLNNDTKADKDWLKHLVAAIDSKERIAAVASNMLFYDNHRIINSQGGTYNFFGEGHDINMYKNRSEVKEARSSVLSTCWGATLIKTEYIKNIGYLDGRYTAYFEDLDWGWRANLFGYKLIFEPKAIVYHKGSSSWKNQEIRKYYLCLRNSLCTMLKNYEFRSLVKILPVIFSNYLFFYIGRLFSSSRKNPDELSFYKRLRYSLIPVRLLLWNAGNLPKTLYLRRSIQSRRKISDAEIFRFFTPVKHRLLSAKPESHFMKYSRFSPPNLFLFFSGCIGKTIKAFSPKAYRKLKKHEHVWVRK